MQKHSLGTHLSASVPAVFVRPYLITYAAEQPEHLTSRQTCLSLSPSRDNRNGGPSAFCGGDDCSGYKAVKDPEEYERCLGCHDAR